MERFIPSREAIFDERAKHSVLLVGAVEESANVTLPAEIAPGKLHGLSLGSHISPQFQSVADLHTEVQRRSAESRGREVGDEEIRCGMVLPRLDRADASENDMPGRSSLQLRSTGPTVLESRARNEYGSGLYLAPIPSRPKARLF